MLTGLLPATRAAAAERATPLVIDQCGTPQHYARVPRRAVSNDVNITEMLLFLGLRDRLVGYTGITSTKALHAELQPELEHVPDLSAQGLNLETIVGAQADFVAAGWRYGFVPGKVTPELLERYGIDSYVITESCIRVEARQRVALEDTLADLRHLADIFEAGPEAIARIARLRDELAALKAKTHGVARRPRVFIYDNGERTVTTAGRFAMPQAMLDLVGGENIFSDIASSWVAGNWEDVIDRDPELIVVIDYGAKSAQQKIDFLLHKPELASVRAIRDRHFLVLTYADVTPGPYNVQAAQRLSAALHPELHIPIDDPLAPLSGAAGTR